MKFGKKSVIGTLCLIIGIGAAVFFFLHDTTSSKAVDSEDIDAPIALQVPLENTVKERARFAEQFKKTPLNDLKPLYEMYIDKIGANGIIHETETICPGCHDQGHDFGKSIYARVKDIGRSLQVCQDAFFSGCMHGVMMAAFTQGEADADVSGHVSIDDVKDRISTICLSEDVTALYNPGDCSHGVGHAVMFLNDYSIEKAIETCDYFPSYPLQYHCASGAYMEYVTTHDKKESETEGLFYPCDTAMYPSACFRFKLIHVFARNYREKKSFREIEKQCEALEGKYRLGCFHGIGNAHMSFIAHDYIGLDDVCTSFGTRDEQFVCIEGAMERMGKIFPEEARKKCDVIEGDLREACIAAATRGLANVNKSFELYPR